MPELREIMDALKDTSDDVASSLDPKGDWEPMLVLTRGGEGTIVAFPMAPNGPEREHLFSTLLPNVIHERLPNPDSVVMVVSTWYLENMQDIPLEEMPLPSESQERKEALLLVGVTKDQEITYMAEIKRGESHPELEWIVNQEDSGFEGRLIGALRRAVWS